MESRKILKEYVDSLNSYYKIHNASYYKFNEFDLGILQDERYNYQDFLNILESRKQSLKDIVKGKEKTRLNYTSCGFGYRELQIELENLEEIRIGDLKNYLYSDKYC